MEDANGTNANTKTIDIPELATVTPIDVTIKDGTEYPIDVWGDVASTIELADAQLERFRAIRRAAEIAYEAAYEQRLAVQEPRDHMIATETRTPAQISRLLGIGRSRCAQIRRNSRKALGL